MSAGQRSKNGCWTCRTRRKKCDEGSPPCGNCEARGLFCHGYGPKPPWKDRGEKERDEARQLHMQTRSRRTQLLTSQSSSSSSPALASFLRPSPDSAVACEGELSRPCLSPSDDLPNIGNFGGLGMSGDFWGPPVLATDILFTSSSDEFNNGAVELPIVPQSGPGLICFPSRTSNEQAANSEHELRYLMHFMGDTFSLLHSGYQPTSLMKRSWLLLLLMRSAPFYYASLSMSAYHESHQLSNFSNPDVNGIPYQDYQTYRTLAIRRLADLREAHQSSAPAFRLAEEEMICFVQLAILEALGDNSQDCRLYLSSALKSLYDNAFFEHENQLLVTQRPSSHSASQPFQTPDLICRSSPMEREALEFYRSLLVWNDILSCSLNATEPSNTSAYQVILRDDHLSFKFEEVVSCQSWILCSILDATQLSNWKREQEAQGHLSVRGLVGRSEKIESVLEQGIQKLAELVGQDPPPSNLLSSHVHSYIFAHAVLVHLNTIVSGYSPGVPEIQQAMDRAIAAWDTHPSLTDLRLLAWPFYVTAVLCLGSQRQQFRQLIADASKKAGYLQSTLPKLNSIVEDVWRKVDTSVMRKDKFSSYIKPLHNQHLNVFFF
ncbi:hypothetical protein UA08_06884 [Talaromyces atroroseus]|uniref:Zn(2)-C6 fungal-type domain-containing protein n=1 Tax=Talaromyces atroroseus TaxID=1441469 RepID=A0A225AHS6_TALAT|nr:hypothetical protein UA08_06884 [Talaromyces atroroseus]OKL57764.1 hypothetical protein UA08_06884 [Talaromyces atroroseus]